MFTHSDTSDTDENEDSSDSWDKENETSNKTRGSPSPKTKKTMFNNSC